jgi:catechol 2,3-dioxygenase-like lactoylglutathione lyase family enzyme
MEGRLMLRFAHVGIVVHDLDRMCAFYRALGFSEFFRIRRDEPWIGEMLGLPGAAVEIVRMASANDLCRIELLHYISPSRPRRDPGGHMLLALWTQEIDARIELAVRAGGFVRSMPPGSNTVEIPAGEDKGTRIAYLADPEGNTVCLQQAPQPIPDRTRALLDYLSVEGRE